MDKLHHNHRRQVHTRQKLRICNSRRPIRLLLTKAIQSKSQLRLHSHPSISNFCDGGYASVGQTKPVVFTSIVHKKVGPLSQVFNVGVNGWQVGETYQLRFTAVQNGSPGQSKTIPLVFKVVSANNPIKPDDVKITFRRQRLVVVQRIKEGNKNDEKCQF